MQQRPGRRCRPIAVSSPAQLLYHSPLQSLSSLMISFTQTHSKATQPWQEKQAHLVKPTWQQGQLQCLQVKAAAFGQAAMSHAPCQLLQTSQNASLMQLVQLI